MNPKLKTAFELGPLFLFFVAYRAFGVFVATAVIMVSTLISLIVIYKYERKLAVMPLVSGGMMLVFGTLTLVLHDEYFVKIKPTIVNLIFAALLLGGVAMRKSIMKYVFDGAFHLTEEGWKKLSIRWGLFFAFLAILNEYIWRNYSTDFWVSFKVFGMFGLTVIFTLAQIPLITRSSIEEK